MMFCGSADGKYLPLMVVYQVQNVYNNWIEAQFMIVQQVGGLT